MERATESTALLSRIAEVVGDEFCLTGRTNTQKYTTEWRNRWSGEPLAVVLPASVSETAELVRLATEQNIAIVPQGGNTGLVGGQICDQSGRQLLISMERLNRIRSINTENNTIAVDAGCTLSAIQQAAEEAGRYFPLSLASEGSCQIGGNVSTNAGGIHVLRYGTMRQQVLGLEVVLPDATVWDGMRQLYKDVAGYDLKQLFIGAEGTLGLITGAVLKLQPHIQHRQTAMLAVQSIDDALKLLHKLQQILPASVQAFELISSRAMRFVCRHLPNAKNPLSEASWYLLIDFALAPGQEIETHLATLLEQQHALDIVLSKSQSEAESLWRMREAISACQKLEGGSIKNDVSVPLDKISSFIAKASSAVENILPGIRVVAFGHLGDGNIHFNLSQPKEMQGAAFLAQRASLETVVNELVLKFGGSCSAEHGIGQAKVELLKQFRAPQELALMRAIKQTLDPRGLFNPGKLF